ncbi:LysR family transcriptional regulator [Azoarcus sp. KH32C]|uniref:LysR family transcriptional regulator n=1 Tax=Azoarcus sp. KH32C TaxID=748247 RepID=UPI0002385C6A|nr:LysR family transcriptional regulator [Azoarcus sp. KH32C]BAL26898.1 transcriptional regulator, LysR family [Azoarcus sp. KH32C]
MDTRKLKHFIALCEHGTFHRAAEVVHLSQSALSRSIQALEQDLGAPLFDRVGHRTQLTVFGRSLAERARRVLFEENELQRELALARAGEFGEIGLGVSPTPASMLVRPCLIALAHERPQLRVNIVMGRTPQLLDELHAEKLDMVVVDATDIVNPGGLDIEPLARLPGDFMCRCGHPLLAMPRVGFDDLLRYPIACSAVSDTLARQLVAAFGPRAHPSRLITYRCDSYEIQREVVLHSDTVLLSVVAIMRAEIESGGLVPLGVMPAVLAGSYALVRLPGRSSSPALDRIADLARTHFRA